VGSCCLQSSVRPHKVLSMRHSLPSYHCGIIAKLHLRSQALATPLSSLLFLRLHRHSFAPTGTCDTIIILQHSFVASASNLLTRIHFLQIMLNVHSLYRFVVNHTRPFSYIMRTPVLLTLFTSLLLGIIVLNHRSLLQGIQVSL
jgi:hypothetical protein